MGRIVVDRTLAAGHDVVAFDLDDAAVERAADVGAEPADSIDDFVDRLGATKRIWLMVPAGEAIDVTLEELEPHLDGDDIVVDGGNSYFEESVRRAESCPAAYLDCGTSGGPAGAELGFSLMVGGHSGPTTNSSRSSTPSRPGPTDTSGWVPPVRATTSR